MKYKVGDRVITTGSIGVDKYIPVGSIGTVVRVHRYDYEVSFDSYPRTPLYANDDKLTLADITKETKLESFLKRMA